MPRLPVGEKAMTAAERQQRRRTRIKAAVADLSPERRFRRDLLAFVETYRALHPKLSTEVAGRSLNALATAIGLDEFSRSERGLNLYRERGWEPRDHIRDYLRAEANMLFYGPSDSK
ncbi:hypothetical protein MKK67_12250 [Methylobacterium sp. J-072]|uniref:hypothetical protein n=1 Tax=Methylobacterium sp. J-072 TaxID=2836651 RepID=UPI001FB9DFB6|nr:hypothetical protein [Methylobacterium sp. J-072]MCJ2093254.1 hypothetical protein [Methylobacterium sp. J-072]